MTSEQIVRPKLYMEVIRRIESMILSGEYKSGDQLPSERELMERYGVGRPAVREALFALQKAGMISINSGERAKVTAPSTDALLSELSGAARYYLSQKSGVEAFQQARSFFEIGLVRHAATHATAPQIEQLRQALAANKAAMGDTHRFEQTDVAFHYVIAEIPGNPLFNGLHSALSSWLLEQRVISLRRPGAEADAYAAHAAILAAIEAHDPDAAEDAMRKHMGEVSSYYWKERSESP